MTAYVHGPPRPHVPHRLNIHSFPACSASPPLLFLRLPPKRLYFTSLCNVPASSPYLLYTSTTLHPPTLEQTVLEESCRKDAYLTSYAAHPNSGLCSPPLCRHSGTCVWFCCSSVRRFAMLMSPVDGQRCQTHSYPKSISKHPPFSIHHQSGLTCRDYIEYIYRW